MPDEDIHTGRCLCGAVRYEARGALRAVIYCHCEECRRQSGHFFACTSVADAGLSVTGDALSWYAASDAAERGFCRTCGSALFWKRGGSGATSILAGSLDDATGLAASHHIFVSEKGAYYAVDDGLPQFPQND